MFIGFCLMIPWVDVLDKHISMIFNACSEKLLIDVYIISNSLIICCSDDIPTMVQTALAQVVKCT